MRIALMAMTEEGDGVARLAGQPLAWHQLHAALAAGCERIVCLAAAPGRTLAALQREAEARGARFNAVAHPRALSGLVHAADTLIVFTPGALPDRDWLTQTLGGRAGIATLPADSAVARGYERIDRERAWAGVLATRGDAVEALAELPPDADFAAGLLRIALQRGARMVEVPPAWLDEGRWALIPDAPTAARFEAMWYAARVPSPGFVRPSETASYHIARALAAGRAMPLGLAPALVTGGAVLAVAGGVAGYLGNTAAGIAVLLTGTVSGGIGSALARFARVSSGIDAKRWPREVRDALTDAALVAIAASPSEFAGWPTPFAALVLVAAIRLAREPDAPGWMRVFGDRTLVIGLSLLAAMAGQFAAGLAVLAVSALATRLFGPKPQG